jgi:hypothetical protein
MLRGTGTPENPRREVLEERIRPSSRKKHKNRVDKRRYDLCYLIPIMLDVALTRMEGLSFLDSNGLLSSIVLVSGAMLLSAAASHQSMISLIILSSWSPKTKT